MLVTLPKTEKVKQTVELKLPAFFKNDYWYYAILTNENVISVSISLQIGCLIHMTTSIDPGHSTRIADALECNPITETEFYFHFDNVLKNLYENIAIPKPT